MYFHKVLKLLWRKKRGQHTFVAQYAKKVQVSGPECFLLFYRSLPGYLSLAPLINSHTTAALVFLYVFHPLCCALTVHLLLVAQQSLPQPIFRSAKHDSRLSIQGGVVRNGNRNSSYRNRVKSVIYIMGQNKKINCSRDRKLKRSYRSKNNECCDRLKLHNLSIVIISKFYFESIRFCFSIKGP